MRVMRGILPRLTEHARSSGSALISRPSRIGVRLDERRRKLRHHLDMTPTNSFKHALGGVTSRAIGTTLAIAAACLLAGCGGTEANKSGASDSDPVNLRLGMPDDGDTLGELFIENVAKRSGGSIRVQLVTDDYSSRLPANESKLARALQQGLVDIGYLPARAWAVEGLPAFKALLAPFVMTTDLSSSGPRVERHGGKDPRNAAA